MKTMLGSAFAAVLTVLAASPAQAGELKLSLNDGRVTLIAVDVPVRQILAEWARIGKTTIVNGEKLMGGPVTLHLEDRPEREVLDILLRAASGYIVASRPVGMANASAYDRILIMPTSRPPAMSAASQAPPFNRPAPQPIQPDVDDDPVEPVPGGAPGNVPPGGNMPGANVPGVNVPGNAPGGNVPGGNAVGPQTAPGMPGAQPQLPQTQSRPGIPTAPPAGQPTPYPAGQPPLPPGVRPPGGGGGI